MGEIDKFIKQSHIDLQSEPKRGRYFHTLKSADSAPLVVHRRTNQFTYVIEGGGKGWFNGEERKLQRGDCVFVPAGTKHKFKADKGGMVLFHIHIPDDGRENDREIIEGEDYDRYE